tara:strand:- start:449 stop:778 length:330 start_codon:yes stop_codon:yes gene_type:complete
MKTFLATFKQATDSTTFKADRHGVLPFVGKVIAGTSRGSIINGTIFEKEALIPNQAYLCHNEDTVFDGKDYTHCRVITQVNTTELVTLMGTLGKAVFIKKDKDADLTAE